MTGLAYIRLYSQTFTQVQLCAFFFPPGFPVVSAFMINTCPDVLVLSAQTQRVHVMGRAQITSRHKTLCCNSSHMIAVTGQADSLAVIHIEESHRMDWNERKAVHLLDPASLLSSDWTLVLMSTIWDTDYLWREVQGSVYEILILQKWKFFRIRRMR